MNTLYRRIETPGGRVHYEPAAVEAPYLGPGIWLVTETPGRRHILRLCRVGEVPDPLLAARIALHGDAATRAIQRVLARRTYSAHDLWQAAADAIAQAEADAREREKEVLVTLEYQETVGGEAVDVTDTQTLWVPRTAHRIRAYPEVQEMGVAS